MKAISLWQPWASFIAWGEKKIETRSRPTDYRGLIAIHASKKWDMELADMCMEEPFWEILCDHGFDIVPASWKEHNLPLGEIVAIANLTNCVSVKHIEAHEWPSLPKHERALGNYAPGRFGFVLGDVHALTTPIPARGQQWLWNWEQTGEALEIIEKMGGQA